MQASLGRGPNGGEGVDVGPQNPSGDRDRPASGAVGDVHGRPGGGSGGPAGRPPAGAGDQGGADLLRLALSRPAEAADRARTLLAGGCEPLDASYAHQALGIVLRDSGDASGAVAQLRAGLARARAAGRPDRVADVRATLGAALVMAGRTGPGLRELDAAVATARGALLGTVLMRRAFVLTLLGRHEASLADLRRALAAVRRAGDVVWEARTLNNRANVELALGDVARADRDIRRAEALFAGCGQELEAVHALHNRGILAELRGDLPAAFRRYDRAAARYAELGAPSADLVLDRCRAHIRAGLAAEAVDLADEALAGELQPRHRAEILLVLAGACLEGGDHQRAADAAARSRRMFHRQARSWWELRARLVLARARLAAGRADRRTADELEAVAAALVAEGSDDAVHALLLTGRVAVARGQDPHPALAAAAGYRHRPGSLVRATAWQAVALDRQRSGDRAGTLRAAGRGLEALDEHRDTLGSSELRALASRPGDELAGTALRAALAARRPRALLAWTERWRATALAPLPVRPPDDPQVAALLAALRATDRRLAEARAGGLPAVALDPLRAEQAALERSVRRRRLHLAGGGARDRRFDLDELIDALGDRTLVELVVVDAVLHALVVRRRVVRHVVVGSADAAARAVERARFALRQAARGRPAPVAEAADGLQRAVLGPVAGQLGDGPVIVSPPGSLHHTPWGLAPVLGVRAVSAVPSALTWLRAAALVAPVPGRTVLVAGPDLPSGGAEVAALATRLRAPEVLVGPQATVERALAALDGASVAHVAAHGRYRADSPTFSSLALADGPLTVHDVERLDRAPHRVVLSACDSGVMAPVGANELLGLATALLAGGSAGVVCTVTEVNDGATVPLMVDLHEGLAGGGRPDQLLLAARRAAGNDPLSAATAAAFTVIGG